MYNSSVSGPNGPAPSVGDPTESRTELMIACVVVAVLVSGAAVGARFYTRGRIQRVLGYEDWTFFAAWVRQPGS